MRGRAKNRCKAKYIYSVLRENVPNGYELNIVDILAPQEETENDNEVTDISVKSPLEAYKKIIQYDDDTCMLLLTYTGKSEAAIILSNVVKTKIDVFVTGTSGIGSGAFQLFSSPERAMNYIKALLKANEA